MFEVVWHQAKWEDYTQTAFYLMYYTSGSLLPVWLGVTILILLGEPIGLGTFLDDGQFAIYAAAALGASLFFLIKQNPGGEIHLLVWIHMICLIIAAAMYAALTIANSIVLEQLHIDTALLRILTLSLFLVSLGMTFYIQLYENANYGAEDIESRRRQVQENLDTEFERELEELED